MFKKKIEAKHIFVNLVGIGQYYQVIVIVILKLL